VRVVFCEALLLHWVGQFQTVCLVLVVLWPVTHTVIPTCFFLFSINVFLVLVSLLFFLKEQIKPMNVQNTIATTRPAVVVCNNRWGRTFHTSTTKSVSIVYNLIGQCDVSYMQSFVIVSPLHPFCCGVH